MSSKKQTPTFGMNSQPNNPRIMSQLKIFHSPRTILLMKKSAALMIVTLVQQLAGTKHKGLLYFHRCILERARWPAWRGGGNDWSKRPFGCVKFTTHVVNSLGNWLTSSSIPTSTLFRGRSNNQRGCILCQASFLLILSHFSSIIYSPSSRVPFSKEGNIYTR